MLSYLTSNNINNDLVPRGTTLNIQQYIRLSNSAAPVRSRPSKAFESRRICCTQHSSLIISSHQREQIYKKSSPARLPSTATQHAHRAPGGALSVPATLPLRASFLTSNTQTIFVKHVAAREHVRSRSPPRARTATAAAAAAARGGDASRPLPPPPPPRCWRPASDRRPSRGPCEGHKTQAVGAAGAGLDASCSPLSLVEPA